jgi:hypothetical protein
VVSNGDFKSIADLGILEGGLELVGVDTELVNGSGDGLVGL